MRSATHMCSSERRNLKRGQKNAGESLFIPSAPTNENGNRNERSGGPMPDLLSLWMRSIIHSKWNHMLNYPMEKGRWELKNTIMTVKISGSSNEAPDWVLFSSLKHLTTIIYDVQTHAQTHNTHTILIHSHSKRNPNFHNHTCSQTSKKPRIIHICKWFQFF